MDRKAILLERLRTRLQGWSRFIQRSVHANAVSFHTVPGNGFKLAVTWVHPRGSGEYVQHFSYDYVFGPGADPMSCVVPMGPCDYAKRVVRAIMVQRGV